MRVIIIMLSIGILLSNSAFAYDHRDNHRYREYSPSRERHVQNLQGWDISPRRAKRSPNCYFYSLYTEGGRGSARLMSISGKNYIQQESGERSGWVCFNRPTTLELGKLSNPNVYVELYIEDIGTFSFDRGDRGSKYINNWYRSYDGL